MLQINPTPSSHPSKEVKQSLTFFIFSPPTRTLSMVPLLERSWAKRAGHDSSSEYFISDE
jgi:hypothetical protein